MKRTPLRSRRAPKRTRRPAAETVRIYGPPSRRTWVKSMNCFGCGQSPCDQAHTETGGMGRKADAATIVPLCRLCHRAYDQHKPPFHLEWARETMKRRAVEVECMWQSRSGGPEHISSVVARVMEEL